jgi:hypothetical protein
VLTNAEIGELLWSAARDESDHRRRALTRASRAARFWPDEARALADAGRPLTDLRAVGPWVAARITGWLEDRPAVPEPDETRRVLTHAEVRQTLVGSALGVVARADLRCTRRTGDRSLHSTR